MDINELLKDHQMYHSDFQRNYFITARAGAGTNYGMYKQALRELNKRYRGLKQLYIDKELLQIDIDDVRPKKNEYDKKRQELNKVKFVMQMEDLDLNIKATEEEFKHFYAQAVFFKKKIGKLTDKKKNELDIDMWVHKIKTDAALDILSTGHVSKGISELIFSLPLETRKILVNEINNKDRLLRWYHERETIVNIPEYRKLDAKKLIGD